MNNSRTNFSINDSGISDLVFTGLRTFSDATNGSDTTSRFLRRSTLNRPFLPECDIVENDNETVIFVNMAGVKKTDINLEFRNDKLIISGEKHKPYNLDSYTLKSGDMLHGRFSKTIKLPIVITNPSSVVRSLEDGILKIKILYEIERENYFSLNIE